MDHSLETVALINHLLSDVLSVGVSVRAIEPKLGQQSQDSCLCVWVSGIWIRSSCLHGRNLLIQHLHSLLSWCRLPTFRFPQIKSLSCTCLSYLLGYPAGPLDIPLLQNWALLLPCQMGAFLWILSPDSGPTFLQDTGTEPRSACGSLFFSAMPCKFTSLLPFWTFTVAGLIGASVSFP